MRPDLASEFARILRPARLRLRRATSDPLTRTSVCVKEPKVAKGSDKKRDARSNGRLSQPVSTTG